MANYPDETADRVAPPETQQAYFLKWVLFFVFLIDNRIDLPIDESVHEVGI